MRHVLREAGLNHRIHRLRGTAVDHCLLRCSVRIHGMRRTRRRGHKWMASASWRHHWTLRVVRSTIVMMLASIILEVPPNITLWHLLKMRHRRHVMNLILKMLVRMIGHELGCMILLLVRRKAKGNHRNRLIIRCLGHLRHGTRTVGFEFLCIRI